MPKPLARTRRTPPRPEQQLDAPSPTPNPRDGSSHQGSASLLAVVGGPAARFPALLGIVLFGVALVVSAALATAPARADGDFGWYTCLEGFVWRQATPDDRVCVTPGARARTLAANEQAEARRVPDGPYGPDTCLDGYVWREAVDGDHVCVTPDERAQAADDNQEAEARRNNPATGYSVYTNANGCRGIVCVAAGLTPRFRLHATNVNVGWVVVELRRLSDDAVLRRWYTYVAPAGDRPGGRLTLDTGVVKCDTVASSVGNRWDAYFQFRDPVSDRVGKSPLVAAACRS